MAGGGLFLIKRLLSNSVDWLYASWQLPPLAAVSVSVQSSLLLRIKETAAYLQSRSIWTKQYRHMNGLYIYKKESRQTVIAHKFVGSASLRLAL